MIIAQFRSSSRSEFYLLQTSICYRQVVVLPEQTEMKSYEYRPVSVGVQTRAAYYQQQNL